MPTLIFKPTEKCNSNCAYCDVVVKKAPKTMSMDLLELIFKRINEYLEAEPDEKMTLIWHGGEPLLLGVDYFTKALDLIDKECKNTKHRIEHGLQTNLTAMKQEYVDIFKRMGMHHVGTSYEPIPHIRGAGKNHDSDGYNRNFFKGINILKQNDLGWGFIYVVTKKSLEDPLGIFYYLSNMLLTGGFMMNPVLVYGQDKEGIAITPMEYVDFLGEIFPVWWKNRHRYPDVDPFKMITRNVVDGEDSLGCVDSGRCAFNHLYIGPSGETSQCGRSEDWGIVDFGNIKDKTLNDIFADKQRHDFNYRTDYLRQNDCKDCRFWGICHGGCPLDAYQPGQKDFNRKTEWCAVRKVFMEKYFEPVTGVKYESPDEDSVCEIRK